MFMLMVMQGPTEDHEGAKPTPSEAAAALLGNLFTLVLATVRCGGWKSNWCNGVMGMLLETYPRCQHVICVAVKGGPATDDEILMFVDILAQLGFECRTEAEVWHSGLVWRWQHKRSDGSMYGIDLYQIKKVEEFTQLPNFFHQVMVVPEQQSMAPELKRVVVLSAPVTTLDGTCVNDVLNAFVNEALEWTKDNMARKGWVPTPNGTKRKMSVAAATAACEEYFDIKFAAAK